MEMPPFPAITNEHLLAIADKHNLNCTHFDQLPEIGMFNRIFVAGEDYVLRIARDHPRSFEVTRTESIVVPLARAAGVRTPELFVMDASCDILPVPYTIYERVHGETLGLLNLEPYESPDVWRAVGQDLALLHCGIDRDGPAADLNDAWNPDPRAWPDELAEAGHFTTLEARWFNRWLEALSSEALAPIAECYRHADMQATNIMVDKANNEFRAIIDWGSSGWGDPAHDFAGSPLGVVPYMLEGYRSVMPLERDETAEARILWYHLTLALGNLRREPEPELSWAERPLGHLMGMLRFLMETDDERWKRLIVT